jgi:hypothetical protein
MSWGKERETDLFEELDDFGGSSSRLDVGDTLEEPVVL